MVPEVPGDGSFPPWHLRRATEAETVQQARAAGWSIGSGLLGMCPRCRRPDPRVVADCRAIQASLPDPPTREVTGA